MSDCECVFVIVSALPRAAPNKDEAIRPCQAMVHTVRPGKYGARKGRGIGSPKPRDKASSRHWTLAAETAQVALKSLKCHRFQCKNTMENHGISHNTQHHNHRIHEIN